METKIQEAPDENVVAPESENTKVEAKPTAKAPKAEEVKQKNKVELKKKRRTKERKS